MKKLAHFNSAVLEKNVLSDIDVLNKRGLLLIEGSHKDSKGRKHTFTPERLEEIVENTNQLLDKGLRLPLLLDHKKEQGSVVGDIDGKLRVEVITEENLPNNKFKDLIGKVGIFVDDMIIKSKKAIDQAKENLLFTISSGLDPLENVIREVSFTPNPAIRGCSTFSEFEAESSAALSFDDLDNEETANDQLEEEYETLTEKLWTLTKNIQNAPEEMLQGVDPQELQMQAIQDFVDRFLQLIGSYDEEQMQDEYQDPRLMQSNGFNPNMSQGFAQAMRPNMPQNSRYNSAPVAAFSMSEMERVNNVEFNIFNSAKQFGSKVIAGARKDVGSIGNAFRTGVKKVRKGSIKPSKIKETYGGVLRAGRRAMKTNTGRIGAGVLGTGAALGVGSAVLGRKKKNSTIINNY